ncbi:MAG: nucleotide exchange factor GrpE [Puniceicoccales bacterium]|jgi:molecular chaperone GrpE|nr:nucleotide exchange factor GrpE [Puniceicoccales bacterium]
MVDGVWYGIIFASHVCMAKKSSSERGHEQPSNHPGEEDGTQNVGKQKTNVGDPDRKLDDAVQDLKNQLADKQKEADNYKDSMLRALADFENYKKRTQKDFFEVRNNAIAGILESLLPILDNFELGLAAADQHGSDKIVDGFKMIFASFKSLLAAHGVQEIFPLNEKFDMHFHECVRRVVDNGKENDTVISVDRKGYKLNDRLLRPAVVTVSYREEQSKESK